MSSHTQSDSRKEAHKITENTHMQAICKPTKICKQKHTEKASSQNHTKTKLRPAKLSQDSIAMH